MVREVHGCELMALQGYPVALLQDNYEHKKLVYLAGVVAPSVGLTSSTIAFLVSPASIDGGRLSRDDGNAFSAFHFGAMFQASLSGIPHLKMEDAVSSSDAESSFSLHACADASDSLGPSDESPDYRDGADGL